jgi:hypothetical protein
VESAVIALQQISGPYEQGSAKRVCTITKDNGVRKTIRKGNLKLRETEKVLKRRTASLLSE